VFSAAVVVCCPAGCVEAQPIKIALRKDRTVSLSKVDFIGRQPSNAHASVLRCNFPQAFPKFFNEICPTTFQKRDDAIPILEHADFLKGRKP
jgi:hypothetical protein